MTRTLNLFISHTWSFADQYEKLCKVLDQAPTLSYIKYLVPPEDPVHSASSPASLHAAIKKQMEPCHVVLMMAGMYVSFSKWVDAEIRIAGGEFEPPKPIVAVRPWAHAPVSALVDSHADRLVEWNADSIVSAILEAAP